MGQRQEQTYKEIVDSQLKFKDIAGHNKNILNHSFENRAFPIAALYNAMCEHLPSYLGKRAIGEIKKSHPTPKLYISVSKANYLEAGTISIDTIQTPDWIGSKEDKYIWLMGMIAIQEIATERLRRDILENITNANPLMKKIIGGYSRLFNKTYDSHPIIEYMHGVIGSIFKEEAETFERELARAMITGNNDRVDQLIGQYTNVKSLDSFAYQITKKVSTTSNDSDSDSKTIDPYANGTELGEVMQKFPGTIFTYSENDVLQFFIACGAAFGLTKIPEGSTHDVLLATLLLASGTYMSHATKRYLLIVMHEICHYLSMDAKRLGFLVHLDA